MRAAQRALLASGLLAALLLAGCSGKAVKPDATTRPPAASAPTAAPSGGGLYAPHIQDGGPPVPPDVSGLAEPVPVDEPLARYGNRSPYTVLGKTYSVLPSAQGYVERGIASWYGTKFHGRPTSSFEPYDMYKFTAAHKSLPLPTFVRVTNLENGRSLIVRVNDRGPFHGDRIIDLSYAAAVRLGVHINGTAQVEVRALSARENTQPPLAAESEHRGRRWLQVGSFGDHANVRSVEQRLREAGFRQQRALRADVGGRSVWRVQIGPLTSTRAVNDAEHTLRKLGFGAPQLVYE